MKRVLSSLAACVTFAACLTAASASLAQPASALVAGTLTFQLEVPISYFGIKCPPGTGAGLTCFARTGVGHLRGLGRVEESYAYVLDESPSGCPADYVRGQPSVARLTVPG